MPPATFVLFALLGALAGSLLALVPALHVYNVAGFVLLWVLAHPEAEPPEHVAMLFMGLVVGYAFCNTIPSIFLSAPDESTIFVVLPGQRYVLEGRGYEAAMLTGLGGLGGLAFLLLIAPLAPLVLPPLRNLTQPHLHWILGLVIVFMLMSEWPRGGQRGTPWRRFFGAWRGLAAGLLTFALSGLLGFVLMYRSPVPVGAAFQNLLPAFVGLFAIPALIVNLLSPGRLPPQHIGESVDATPGLVARGVAAGSLGGMFAAFFPVVTGGVGGFLAGHATAQRDTRVFIISQGANKVVYYVGAYLLFFMPNLHLARGGLASTTSAIFTAYTPAMYYTTVAAMALSGALAFFLLQLFSRGVAKSITKISQRRLAAGTLVILLAVVGGLTGWGGLAVAGVAAGIGLIPVLWGSRRMNCLGVLLLPVTLNMAGWGAGIAKALGLI
jgi:putative membrane protein